jgi:F-type H+-transporting ATPase subunit gamma
MRLKDIDEKINYLDAVKKYINAMNLLSINKYRKYYAELSVQYMYFLRLKEVLGMLVYLYKGGLLKREEKSMCLVLLSTDRGFVGSFNEILAKKVLDFLEQTPIELKRFIVIGKKGAEYFKNRKDVEIYTDVFRKDIDWEKAQVIFQSVVEQYMMNYYDAVYIAVNRPVVKGVLYAERVEKGKKAVEGEKVQAGEIFYELFKKATPKVPVAIGHITSYSSHVIKFIPPVLEGSYMEDGVMNFEGDEELILKEVLRLYLNFLFREIFLEHFSAELSARFIKTREIIKAIDKKRSQLSHQKNKLRQERINNELIDLVNIHMSIKEKLFKDVYDTWCTLEVSEVFNEESIEYLKERLGIKKVLKRKDITGFRIFSKKSLYDFTLEGLFRLFEW